MKRKCLPAVATVWLCLASVTLADPFGSGANRFHIDFVTIPGSVGDGYGGQSTGSGFTTSNIDHDYRMGVHEITNDQWNKFAASLGVPVTGTPPTAYDTDPIYTGANVPTNSVSWYEAAQFVNWLNTLTGHHAAYKFTGTQGTSTYAPGTWGAAEAAGGTNLYRHKDAFYSLPTEDEWVKAAYWNGASLQTWATPGDTAPVAGVDANFGNVIGQPWDVGSGSEELNGTYDMMGNVWEWMESPYNDPGFGVGAERSLRGGSFGFTGGDTASTALESAYRAYTYGSHEYADLTFKLGFRVAAEVPEPASLCLLATGVLALLRRRGVCQLRDRRSRRRANHTAPQASRAMDAGSGTSCSVSSGL